MSVYGWKSFLEDEDRPEKPRRYGVTEMRGPNFTSLNRDILQVSPPLFFSYIINKLQIHFRLFLVIFFFYFVDDEFLVIVELL